MLSQALSSPGASVLYRLLSLGLWSLLQTPQDYASPPASSTIHGSLPCWPKHIPILRGDPSRHGEGGRRACALEGSVGVAVMATSFWSSSLGHSAQASAQLKVLALFSQGFSDTCISVRPICATPHFEQLPRGVTFARKRFSLTLGVGKSVEHKNDRFKHVYVNGQSHQQVRARPGATFTGVPHLQNSP